MRIWLESAFTETAKSTMEMKTVVVVALGRGSSSSVSHHSTPDSRPALCFPYGQISRNIAKIVPISPGSLFSRLRPRFPIPKTFDPG